MIEVGDSPLQQGHLTITFERFPCDRTTPVFGFEHSLQSVGEQIALRPHGFAFRRLVQQQHSHTLVFQRQGENLHARRALIQVMAGLVYFCNSFVAEL